ncbi:RDD family protein [Ignavibacteria bacterium]|jgi:uncharacterized RDD family membrane protein YckC|nr:RDD family protein [Bacteroidota bacterium]MCZ2132618.1 RDD family protein [Bacteroidota bacterium]
MDYVNIQTAQNVAIQYEAAGIGDRIGAYFIDALVISAYIVLVVILFANFSSSEFGSTALFVILSLPVFLYDLVLEFATDGQSVGKKIMNLKVVMLDGSQPNIGAYLLRWLLRLADCTLSTGGVAIVTIAINGKGQRLGDIAAGTCVVKIRKQMKLEDFSTIEAQTNYIPAYPQAIHLSDNDAAIIRETLRTALQQQNDALLNALAVKVSAIIGIEKPDDNKIFLKTLLNDYAALTRNTSH